jgi:hypothetical protein
MATLQKFYLRDIQAPIGALGTLPSASVSARTPTINGLSTAGNRDKAASRSKGAAQTSIAVTSSGVTTQQFVAIGQWLSEPLAAQTIGAGNWTASLAASEANAQANMFGALVVAVYRPSTNSIVGRIVDQPNAATSFGLEPGTAETAISGTTIAGSSLTVQDGDILVFEIWSVMTMASTTARLLTIFFNGTTDASATTNAAFVSAPAAITLFAGSPAYPSAGSALVEDFTYANGTSPTTLTTISSGAFSVQTNALTGAAVADTFGYFNTVSPVADVEIQAKIATLPAATHSCYLGWRTRDLAGTSAPTSAATWTGYFLQISSAGILTINVYNGSVVTKVADIDDILAAGDTIGVRMQGTVIEVYLDVGSAGDWRMIASVADITYSRAGNVHVELEDTTVRIDHVLAGPFSTGTSKSDTDTNSTTTEVAVLTVQLTDTNGSAGLTTETAKIAQTATDANSPRLKRQRSQFRLQARIPTVRRLRLPRSRKRQPTPALHLPKPPFLPQSCRAWMSTLL